MKKVIITGNVWNEMVAIQDKLVLLHNGLEDKPLYLTWDVSPYIGMLKASLFDMDEDGMLKDYLDGFTCYADGWKEEYTFDHAIDTITEWEKTYGLLNAEP